MSISLGDRNHSGTASHRHSIEPVRCLEHGRQGQWCHAVRVTSAMFMLHVCCLQVLHLAATATPNQDAAFMMGIGWTCTNLVMSGFLLPYRVSACKDSLLTGTIWHLGLLIVGAFLWY